MFESTTHWLIEPRTVSSENAWFILSQKKMSEIIIAFRENSNNIRCLDMELLITYNVPHWDVKDHVVALLRHGVKESRNRVLAGSLKGTVQKNRFPYTNRTSHNQRAHDPVWVARRARWQYSPPTRLERMYVFTHARQDLCQGTKVALYHLQLYSGKNFSGVLMLNCA